MEIASEIARQLRKLTSAPDLLHVAKVVKVEGETCTVDLGGLELSGVRLRAVADGSDTGLLLSPKVGSYVLVADLSDGALRQLAVIAYSEVDTISIHGGDKGGLVNIKQLTDKINALINAFNTHTHYVKTAGTAAAQAGTTAATTTQVQTFKACSTSSNLCPTWCSSSTHRICPPTVAHTGATTIGDCRTIWTC